MAPPASPRDHAADADPEISRKRARLSEEGDSPVSGGPIEIEALAPEIIGGDPIGTIDIEDDDAIMGLFSATFPVSDGRTPIDTVSLITEILLSNKPIDPTWFLEIAEWLVQHIESTTSVPEQEVEDAYRRDLDFFGQFAVMALTLLHRNVWFRKDAVSKYPGLSNDVGHFMDYLMQLSVRFINILPEISREQIARKDSASDQFDAIEVPVFSYIKLAGWLITLCNDTASHLRIAFGLKIGATAKLCRERIPDHEATARALVAVYRDVTERTLRVKDAWAVIDPILCFACVGLYQDGDALAILETTKKTVLPTICEKRPRDLPPGLHERLVVHSGEILQALRLRQPSFDHARHVYERLLRDDADVLLSEADAVPQGLKRLCNGDPAILNALLRAAWELQAHRAFILSGIMDVRNYGISMMCAELAAWYNKCCKTTAEGVDHPLIQHAARFLRKNALIEYIFSAESHANIVEHSEQIVAFLAVTFNYTDFETDAIWNACTTSVEADFVQAAFRVLERTCRHLSFQQLHYVVRKFTVTPLAPISNHAALATLNTALFCLHESMPATTALQDCLAIVLLALDLLMHIHANESLPYFKQYLQLAMQEIHAATSFPLEDKIQIYERCVPHVTKTGPSSTAAFKVLDCLLAKGIQSGEGKSLLAMLPPEDVVNELCNFERQIIESGEADPARLFEHLSCRISVVTYLLGLAFTDDDDLCDRLFESLFGPQAGNHVARDIAWAHLVNLSKSITPRTAAKRLFERYSQVQIPALPAKLATPHLITMVRHRLMEQVLSTEFETQYSALLQQPLWQALVRFAVECPGKGAGDFAFEGVQILLFEIPQKFEDKGPSIECQVEFLKTSVDDICSRYKDFSTFEDEARVDEFRRAMRLFEKLCGKSRETLPIFQTLTTPDSILLDDANDQNLLRFTVQVCAPGRPQEVIQTRCSSTSTFQQLVDALQERTGAKLVRIIVGGKAVDVAAEPFKTIGEGGVQVDNVVTAYPVYDSSCSFAKMLPELGPFEQELVLHHDQLEHFLDGPPAIAQSVGQLLSTLRPSESAAYRILHAPTSASELLPMDKYYRTTYTIHLLRLFLGTYAKFGIADLNYVLRGVHLLADCVIDRSRLEAPGLFLQTLWCLTLFLQERPRDMATESYFPHPEALASAVAEHILKVLRSVQTFDPSIRQQLLVSLYKVFLEACRIDTTVWEKFMNDPRRIELHAALLLDSDPSVSTGVATAIDNFSGDEAAPTDRTEKLWAVVAACLDEALIAPGATGAFFNVSANILARNAKLQEDESAMRDLVQMLAQKLLSYSHFESPELPVGDPTMLGLLRLLGIGVNTLKSFKKPVNLGNLSSEVFARLLFPDERRVINSATRDEAFSLVKSTCETPDDFCALIQAVQTTITDGPLPPNAQLFPGLEGWIRPVSQHAGLTNLGMTCYMNSLLQQLFANFALRKFVFESPIVDIQKQGFLACVQRLFAQMQDGVQASTATNQLAEYLDIAIGNQEDVHTFYGTFLNCLEDSMPDQEHKKSLASCYGGSFVSQIRGSCGHVSTSTEPFNDVSITVKNKATLFESLSEFVQGEPMQGANKYRCQTCDTGSGRLVDAMKRTCLDRVPDHLTFCLKRFTFESMMGLEGKVNDRFEFPEHIDMAQFERQHLEHPQQGTKPDIFDLVGVIVHQGDLGFGHYWSYCKVANSAKWVRLEDTVSPTYHSFAQVQPECFGGLKYSNGQERTNNAYVLFYRRPSNSNQEAQSSMQAVLSPQMAHQMPLRAEPPQQIASEISGERMWRHRIAHMFSPAFANFTEWLTSAALAGKQDSPSDVEPVATLAAHYLLRVVFTDRAAAPKAKAASQCMKFIIDSQHIHFSEVLADTMLSWPDFCAAMWRHEDGICIQVATEIVMACLRRLREGESAAYFETLERMLTTHASQLSNIETVYPRCTQYLMLPASIAGMGARETAAVLDKGYLISVLNIAHLRTLGDENKRQHWGLWNSIKEETLDMSPVFSFLYEVLAGYVDLVAFFDLVGEHRSSSSGLHEINDSGLVCLTFEEARLISASIPIKNYQTWYLLFVGCACCPPTPNYDAFPPGLLVGLVAGKTSDTGFLEGIENTMMSRFDHEENNLVAMLQITYHLVNAMKYRERDVRLLLQQLGKNLPLWATMGEDVLHFYSHLYRIVPIEAIESAEHWAEGFLEDESPRVRSKTQVWLQKFVFPVTSAIDRSTASRLRLSRALARSCTASLKHGYDREEGRYQYEERLTTMKVVKKWLELLREGVHEITGGDITGNGGGIIDRELLTELDESRATLNLIDNTLEELDGWEEQTLAEVSMPDGRRSAEAEDSGSLADLEYDDDAEVEDDLSDDSDTSGR
ncbi:hypothetical protein KC364_g9617 [Hortaea werneckii]|uniref:USP domain-containing protein n=1 Tax=Hortaea werneckii TaxID=91943 RepID=A0A3M7I738_HORWE|nr:hypothetical protein KC364_g9617 [Hortaea werneckii]RMZ21192.1 hypothetical protein D0859_14802 [Hortaea werneckii]